MFTNILLTDEAEEIVNITVMGFILTPSLKKNRNYVQKMENLRSFLDNFLEKSAITLIILCQF